MGRCHKDLKAIRTSWEGVNREALDRLGWRRSVRSCVGLRRLGAAGVVVSLVYTIGLKNRHRSEKRSDTAFRRDSDDFMCIALYSYSL